MSITIEELREIADMTVRLCEIEVDGQVAHSTDKAPELFGGLLRAYQAEAGEVAIDDAPPANPFALPGLPKGWEAATRGESFIATALKDAGWKAPDAQPPAIVPEYTRCRGCQSYRMSGEGVEYCNEDGLPIFHDGVCCGEYQPKTR
jgi:hypothetical protein